MKQLPTLPLKRPYYTTAAALWNDGTAIFKGVIANPGGEQRAFVFKLPDGATKWEEVPGDWQDDKNAEKPNTIALNQDGESLLVDLSVRGSKASDYPDVTFIVDGACAVEDALPLNSKAYKDNAEVNTPSEGKDGLALRLSKQLMALNQFQRIAKRRGWLK